MENPALPVFKNSNSFIYKFPTRHDKEYKLIYNNNMVKNNREFRIKFRGVRGSHPVCSKKHLEFGGNTACVEVMANNRLIILDGGTGIINLGSELVRNYISSGTDHQTRKPVEAVILSSHPHLDHIQGLPFFKPAYIKSSNIHIFGLRAKSRDFGQILSETIFSSIFPLELKEMSANISISNINETQVILLYPDRPEPELIRLSNEKEPDVPEGTVVISCMKSHAHPKDGVLVYKISCNGRSLVYSTDKEGYIGGDSKLTNFARNAALLIHDAQFTQEEYTSPVSPKQGYGHSTPEMAIEAAKLANAGQLVLFHHDPGYDDDALKQIEEKAKKALKSAIMAYEGLEIDLMKLKQ